MCVTAKREGHGECVALILLNFPRKARENTADIGTIEDVSAAFRAPWDEKNRLCPALGSQYAPLMATRHANWGRTRPKGP